MAHGSRRIINTPLYNQSLCRVNDDLPPHGLLGHPVKGGGVNQPLRDITAQILVGGLDLGFLQFFLVLAPYLPWLGFDPTLVWYCHFLSGFSLQGSSFRSGLRWFKGLWHVEHLYFIQPGSKHGEGESLSMRRSNVDDFGKLARGEIVNPTLCNIYIFYNSHGFHQRQWRGWDAVCNRGTSIRIPNPQALRCCLWGHGCPPGGTMEIHLLGHISISAWWRRRPHISGHFVTRAFMSGSYSWTDTRKN